MGHNASSGDVMSVKLPRLSAWAFLIPVLLLAVSAALCLHLWGPFTGDSPRYLQLARNLAEGHGFSAAKVAPYEPEVFRAPLYPLFLSLLLRSGGGLSAMIAVQLFLHLTAAWCVARLLTTAGVPAGAGLLAATVTCAHPALVRWSAAITTESLCMVLFCATALLVTDYLRAPSPRRAIYLGLCWAALFLVRAEFIVLAPVLLGFAALRSWRAAPQTLACLLLAMAVPSGLWIARNLSVVPGVSRPFGAGAGMTLWIRCVEIREPDIPRRDRFLADPRFHTLSYGTDPRAAYAADRALGQEAVEVFRQHPGPFVSGAVVKAGYREWVEQYSPGLPRPLLLLATTLSTALLLLSFGGLCLAFRRFPLLCAAGALCLTVGAVHAIGGTEARYTTPVRPVLYVFAALSLTSLFSRRQSAAARAFAADGVNQ
jgi:hypothetical protein